MTTTSIPVGRWWPYIVLSTAAIGLGVWARFKGLDAAPFENDEYFLARSTQNILRTGLPEFECGGYYTRGLSVQYASALLRLMGLSPESALRLITALSSLVAMPALFKLGFRLHSRAVGWLAVGWLALSVWDVEMARFGRMYAPFAAIFAWYCLYFVRYVVDEDELAYVPMLLLTLLGVLTFEGGALLAIANFVPLVLAFHQREPLRTWGVKLIAAVILFAFAYRFVQGFRTVGPPAFPRDYSSSMVVWPGVPLYSIDLSFAKVVQDPVWAAAFAVVLVTAGAALAWLWSLRSRPLVMIGLAVVLGAALLHQFLICVAGVLLLLLFNLVSIKDLTGRRARWFLMAVVLSAVFWIGRVWVENLAAASTADGLAKQGRAIASAIAGFPNVLEIVLVPLVKAVPVLCAVMVVLLTIAAWQALRGSGKPAFALRVLLALAIILLLVVGLTQPPRVATRYAYFLYPLAVVIAVAGLARGWNSWFGPNRGVGTATALVAIGTFMLTEDFNPRHLVRIDAHDVIFRDGMRWPYAAHLVARPDWWTLAAVLEESVEEQDVVISMIPTVERYYPRVDYMFTEWRDPRFGERACNEGRTERWTNTPFLYTRDMLDAVIANYGTAYLVLSDSDREAMLEETGSNGALLYSEYRTSIVRLTSDEVDARSNN